jgi:hypothetical protein
MKNTKNLTCRYCGNLLKGLYIPYCDKHKSCVEYQYSYQYSSTGYVANVRIGDSGSYVQFWLDKSDMMVYKNYKFITYVSMDPNLTPDNFEQKFKTYLNFS